MAVCLNKDIDDVCIQIVNKYGPEKILLFGSYARGDVTEDSDVDLLIVKDTDEEFLGRLRNVRRGLKYNIPLDILIYWYIPLWRSKGYGIIGSCRTY